MLNKNCPGNESLTIALTDLKVRTFYHDSYHVQKIQTLIKLLFEDHGVSN